MINVLFPNYIFANIKIFRTYKLNVRRILFPMYIFNLLKKRDKSFEIINLINLI